MNDEVPEEARRLWQDQPVEPVDLPVASLRRRAAALDRTVRFRDLREYLAGGILAVVWLGAALAPDSPGYMRAYALVSLAGAIVVLRHLWRHGRSKPVEPVADAPTAEHVAFLRARLEAQRTLLASVWRWYIGPLVPGVIVLVAGVAISAPPPRWRGRCSGSCSAGSVRWWR